MHEQCSLNIENFPVWPKRKQILVGKIITPNFAILWSKRTDGWHGMILIQIWPAEGAEWNLDLTQETNLVCKTCHQDPSPLSHMDKGFILWTNHQIQLCLGQFMWIKFLEDQKENTVVYLPFLFWIELRIVFFAALQGFVCSFRAIETPQWTFHTALRLEPDADFQKYFFFSCKIFPCSLCWSKRHCTTYTQAT